MRSISAEKSIYTAAAVPGIIMSLLSIGMLVADLTIPGMDEAQYIVYPMAYRIVSTTAAICAVLCFAHTIMSGKSVINAITVLPAVFILWMLISTAVNGFTADAVNGVPYRYLGVAEYIICIAAFMGCSAMISSENSRHTILILYIAAADLIAAAALYDRITGAVPPFGNKEGLSAVFFHGNHYGYFLVMAVLISAGYCIYGNGRKLAFGIGSLVLNLLALGANQTLGCVLSTGAAVIIEMIIVIVGDRGRLRRMLILVLFLIAASAVAVIVSETVRYDLYVLMHDIRSITSGGRNGMAGHRRWLLWSETIGYIREKPLLGYGCEGIQDMLNDATGVSSAHNEVLTLMAFFGIPGGSIYVAWIIAALTESVRKRDRSIASGIAFMASCGYFLSSLLGVAMFYTLPYFFVFTGISISGQKEALTQENKSETQK